MSRYDKYDPKVGGFRAPLAADFNTAFLGHAVAVGLDTNGFVLAGSTDNKGTTGLIGVLVLTKARKAGDIVDVMTFGEIADFGPFASGTPTSPKAGVDFGAAGSKYYGHPNGSVDTTATGVGSIYLGHTVESSRLVVRVDREPSAS